MQRYLTELVQLLKLALPVSLAQLCLVGMGATDVLIAGRASTVDLAGMNLGTNIWNMIVLFFMAIGFATQPLVANHFGAKNNTGVKRQLHQSMWMCFALGVIAMMLVWLSSWVMTFAGFEPALQSIAQKYLLAIGLCAIPMTMIAATRGTLEGMSQPRVIFWVNLVAFLVNIPLDYALVNGYWGFPKLGGVGCAWATVLLVWLMFFATLGVLAWHKQARHLSLLKNFQAPDIAAIRKTLKLGVPIGLSVIIEFSMFSGAGIMIARFGSVEAGAHAVAITIAAMSFMLYLGLGQGVTIRASQLLGAAQDADAWYAVKAGTSLNLLVSVLMCVTFLIFNESLVRLFSSDVEVIRIAVVLLYFGAAFQIADCLQVAAVCALRAYHDTASPPKYQFVAFWVFGLPIGIGLAFYDWWPGLEGAKGLWFGMVGSLFMVGVLLSMRLLKLHKNQSLGIMYEQN